jgi:hypothetical protein
MVYISQVRVGHAVNFALITVSPPDLNAKLKRLAQLRVTNNECSKNASPSPISASRRLLKADNNNTGVQASGLTKVREQKLERKYSNHSASIVRALHLAAQEDGASKRNSRAVKPVVAVSEDGDNKSAAPTAKVFPLAA